MKRQGVFMLIFLLNFVCIDCLKNEEEDIERISGAL